MPPVIYLSIKDGGALGLQPLRGAGQEAIAALVMVEATSYTAVCNLGRSKGRSHLLEAEGRGTSSRLHWLLLPLLVVAKSVADLGKLMAIAGNTVAQYCAEVAARWLSLHRMEWCLG